MAYMDTVNVRGDLYNIQDPRIGGSDGSRVINLSLSGDTLTFTHPTTGKKANYTLQTWYRYGRGSALTDSVTQNWVQVNETITTNNFKVVFKYSSIDYKYTYNITKTSNSRISGSVTISFTAQVGTPTGTQDIPFSKTLSFNGGSGSVHSDSVYYTTNSNEIGTGTSSTGDILYVTGSSMSGVQHIINFRLTCSGYTYSRTNV